jgi:hypothetical protein
MMDFLKDLFEVETNKEVFKMIFIGVVATCAFYSFTWLMLVLNLLIDIY